MRQEIRDIAPPGRLSRLKRWLRHLRSSILNLQSLVFSHQSSVFLLLLLTLLFFWRLWAPNPADRQTFAYGDFVEQFYPLRRFAADELKAGRLPLWNPHIYAGTPALADPQWAALYPPAWLSALIPPWPPLPFEVLELEAVAHVALAALFTYLFARRHVGGPGAFLAALVYAFGGYLTSYPPLQLAVLETAAWLPLCLGGVEGLMEDGGWRTEDRGRVSERSAGWRVARAALPLALAFLAGHPQTCLLMAYTTVAYALVLARRARFLWRRLAARLALWGLAVAGLTAGQWLPTLEFARLGPRLVLPYAEAAVGFTWRDLLHIVLPGAWGAWSPLYVGAAPLLLAGVAVARRRGGFWVGLALVGLLLSLGTEGGLYWLAYHVAPGFSLFRHQERAAVLWSFALAMLAGEGLRLMTEDLRLKIEDLRLKQSTAQSSVFNHQSSIIIPPLLVGLAAVALVALWAWRGQPGEGRLALWSSLAVYAAVMLGVTAWLLGRLHGRGPLVALLGLVVLDLFSTGGRGLMQMAPPSGYFAPNPLVWAVQADMNGPFRVSSEGLLPPGGGNGAILWRLEDVVGNSPLHLAAYDALLSDVPELVWWRLLNVRYVVTQRDLPSALVAEVERVGEARLYRLAGSLPRAWLVPGVRVASDEVGVRAALAEPGFDPLAHAVTADLVGAKLGLPTEGTPLLEAQADVERQSPLALTVRTQTPQPALLVLSEAYAPGWRAWVNGQPAPVLAVDGLLRGTPVPAGASTVVWRYEPWTVTVGLALSGLTLAALAGAIGWGRRRRTPEDVVPGDRQTRAA